MGMTAEVVQIILPAVNNNNIVNRFIGDKKLWVIKTSL